MTEQQIRDHFPASAELSEAKAVEILESLVELGAEKAWPIMLDLAVHKAFSLVMLALKDRKHNEFSMAIMMQMGYPTEVITNALKEVERLNAKSRKSKES